MDTLELLNKTCEYLNEIDNYFKTLDDELSICDSKLSDIYHFIENNDLTPTQSKKIVTEIKNVCLKRRKIKKDINLRKIYQDNQDKIKNKDNRSILLEKLYKQNKDITYKNRVYEENEINNIIGLKIVENK